MGALAGSMKSLTAESKILVRSEKAPENKLQRNSNGELAKVQQDISF